MAAICPACELDMQKVSSCAVRQFEDEDKPRIPYDPELLGPWPDMPSDHRCGDCGIKPGGIHHLNCDMEICPICEAGQAISCDCNYD